MKKNIVKEIQKWILPLSQELLLLLCMIEVIDDILGLFHGLSDHIL